MTLVVQNETRLRHALVEMSRHGLVKNGRLPLLQRLMMRLGETPAPLHYAPFGRVMWAVGGIAALPLTAMIWPVTLSRPDVPGWAGLAFGLGAGMLLGVACAFYFEFLHNKLNLTPWDWLDAPPEGPAPDSLTQERLEILVHRYAGRFN